MHFNLKRNILYISIIICLTLFFFVSCRDQAESNNNIAPNKKNETKLKFEDDVVIASADGYKITRSELKDRIMVYQTADKIIRDKDKMIEIVKMMLEAKVLSKKAEELNYQNDEDYIEKEKQLKLEFETKKEEALIKTMFTKEVEKRYEYDEEGLKNFWELNKRQYEKRAFSEILRVVEDPTDEQEVKKVEKEIRMVYDKLKKGAKFEELAKEYHNGHPVFRERGGQLGVIRRGKYPKKFEEMGYDVLEKEGEISEPFLYNQGWAIIRVDKIYGFEELKPYIKREYERKTKEKINRELAEKYLKPARDIDINILEIEKMLSK